MNSVKTQVTPGRGFKVMYVADGDLPIIHPPIVLPAPAPGTYRQVERRTLRSRLKWYRNQIKRDGLGEAWPWIAKSVQAEVSTYWFFFKVRHGFIQNDRTWLFKR